jgi:hypothetical protein
MKTDSTKFSNTQAQLDLISFQLATQSTVKGIFLKHLIVPIRAPESAEEPSKNGVTNRSLLFPWRASPFTLETKLLPLPHNDSRDVEMASCDTATLWVRRELAAHVLVRAYEANGW